MYFILSLLINFYLSIFNTCIITYFYSFISNTSSNYNNSVVEKIVDGLSNLRNNKDKEAFINFVVDEFFVLSNKKRQETLLELFDDKKVAVDFSENKEETISVSPYVHSIVNNSDRPMEFVNKDTGLKIFVKTAKKKGSYCLLGLIPEGFSSLV